MSWSGDSCLRGPTSPGYKVPVKETKHTAHLLILPDLITPAQYWHNPLNNEEFLEGSHYLADINNERPEKNSVYKENLEKLENFVMAKWVQDTTIIPGPSAQFGFYLQGQVRQIWRDSGLNCHWC